MSEVFVSHPCLQHSYQLAWALHERGMLLAFWSGVPVIEDGKPTSFWMPARFAKRLKCVPIPAKLRRHPLLFQILLKMGRFIPGSFSQEDYSHRIFHLFDWWVARQISLLRPKVVVAYENSAYHTFQAAKKIGALCILDAPSLQHEVGARLLDIKQTPYLAEINRRKDVEVELADLILTCSPLAAESYIGQGVNPTKVKPMLLGATLPQGVEIWREHDAPLHFVFAGTLSSRKSIDLILNAFFKLHAEGLPYQLSFIGGAGEGGWVEKILKTPNANYLGNLPQSEMYRKLSQADCLLLPSRFDSFGMVVAEAMACGTPAIVSNQTGAKAMIEQFPGSGWVVDCNEQALYQCVKNRILDRKGLFAARPIALAASKHFTWRAYRERVGQYLQEWLVR